MRLIKSVLAPALVPVLASALAALLMPGFAQARDKLTEADYNKIYCDSIGGQTEVRHDYTTDAGETGYVIVDCETDTEVIEGGLDKRSSLDSIQQALFFAFLTGKKPVIVIYDTDGIEGKIEYRIKIGAAHAGVGFTKSPGSG